MTPFERITRDPRIMGGKPCVRDTRVIVGMLGSGHDTDKLLADYPYLTPEDIQEALRFAGAASR